MTEDGVGRTSDMGCPCDMSRAVGEQEYRRSHPSVSLDVVFPTGLVRPVLVHPLYSRRSSSTSRTASRRPPGSVQRTRPDRRTTS